MKKTIAAAAAFWSIVSFAYAGEAQGVITGVDANAGTMMLDNGETYKLPEEFDASLIGEGMVVAIAFEDSPEKIITDMEQLD